MNWFAEFIKLIEPLTLHLLANSLITRNGLGYRAFHCIVLRIAFFMMFNPDIK